MMIIPVCLARTACSFIRRISENMVQSMSYKTKIRNGGSGRSSCSSSGSGSGGGGGGSGRGICGGCESGSIY